MLRSLMSGVSGVRGHQTLLDVVGNNISNANTTGFKKSSVSFQELMSQTEQAATAPGSEKGGTNPKQVGLGMNVGAVNTDHSQGNINYTGASGDMAIEGDGYFVVGSGDGNVYSRAGNFILDGQGNMVQSGTGYRMQGFAMTDDPLNPGQKVVGSELRNINIPVGQKLPAKATTTVGFRCNLDSRASTVLPMGLSSKDLLTSGIIGGQEYSSITFAEGGTTGDFLTATFRQPDGTEIDVDFAFEGVNTTTGLPALADASADLDGDGTAETLHFDDGTGQLQVLSSVDGSHMWSADLGAAMNYEIVEIDDGSGGTLNYLAEFNDLSDGSRQAVFWGDDGSGTMERVAQEIECGDDGTFIVPDGTQITLGNGLATPQDIAIEQSSSGMGIALNQGGTVIDNFDLQTASIHNTKFDIYDSQGNAYTLETSWEKVDNNLWRWRAWLPDDPGISLSTNTGLVEFSPDGLVESVTDPSGAQMSTLGINFGTLGATDSDIALDFTGDLLGADAEDAVTQFGSAFTTKEYFQDGYEMGVLNDYSVGSDGIIRGVYDNGQTQDLYNVAMAVFSNPSGLEKLGGGAFRETANSGIPQIVRPMEGGAGNLAGKSVEASNVDLTEEFVDLIQAQRGFQASARVITTSDQVLEDLMNLKR
ncbi:MAG: flagellar hook protein FlgE [Thermovirgaceae bacterium]